MQALIRFCIATLLLSIIYTGAQAQKVFFLFAHGQYASPVRKSFNDNYGFGLGGEAGAGIGAGKTFFTGTVGYSIFDARSGREVGNLTMIPIKFGVRHYMLPAKLIYIHADAGMANLKVKGGESFSRFTADVGGGVKLGPFELGIAYDGFVDDGFNSWVGFKAGWRIGL
jgi:hypothetical protein